MVRHCVWSRNLVNEETLAHWGLSRQIQNKKNYFVTDNKYINMQRVSFHMRREENQLDVTECFIALMIRSTCFGHFYAHHQELETVCVLLPPMVCNAVGVKRYD